MHLKHWRFWHPILRKFGKGRRFLENPLFQVAGLSQCRHTKCWIVARKGERDITISRLTRILFANAYVTPNSFSPNEGVIFPQSGFSCGSQGKGVNLSMFLSSGTMFLFKEGSAEGVLSRLYSVSISI